MALFGKTKKREAPTRKPPKPKLKKKEKAPEDDPILIPLKPDPPGAPPQRGFIASELASTMRLQLKVADNLRQRVLAPDLPLDMPLERTDEREQVARKAVEDLIQGGRIKVPNTIKQPLFIDNVLNEIFGYGPIEPLIEADDVSEIMVNGPFIIFIERKGKIVESGHKFLNDNHVERIVARIVKPLGRRANSDEPLIDARLPDGSRVNSVIRPCALDGPNITIRKFSKDKLKMEDLINFGSLTSNMARFLEALVVSRRNIVVSGGTGSGKTTLINVLSAFIPEHERTVTIEDAAELQFKQRNVVRLETKKPTPDSPTEISIRDCVVNALRMRPERIVIGECRSGEALDMLQAMNTGHDGSMTTVHSNSPRDCISRLETLVLMAGVDLPLTTVRRQISSAVHFIVQASRLRDGSRKVTYITEVQGMEGDIVTLTDIFKFHDTGDTSDGKVDGIHQATGIRPKSDYILRQNGFNLPATFFFKD